MLLDYLQELQALTLNNIQIKTLYFLRVNFNINPWQLFRIIKIFCNIPKILI